MTLYISVQGEDREKERFGEGEKEEPKKGWFYGNE